LLEIKQPFFADRGGALPFSSSEQHMCGA